MIQEKKEELLDIDLASERELQNIMPLKSIT